MNITNSYPQYIIDTRVRTGAAIDSAINATLTKAVELYYFPYQSDPRYRS